MSRLLRPEGRLVLTSRTWELVRAGGSRLDIRDHLVRRNGRDALVIYRWEIAPHWEQEHHIEIAVAQVTADGSVLVRSELLSCWPYRYDELGSELHSLGLRIEKSTFDPEAEGYMVVATKEYGARMRPHVRPGSHRHRRACASAFPDSSWGRRSASGRIGTHPVSAGVP